MTSIADLRGALDDIPAPLLGEEDAQVLTETRTSLDALESLDIVPTVVVFVGSSGSGKSSLVNAAIGVSAVATGPVRPTTDRIVMVGSSGPVSLSAESEYLHVPSVRPGLLVIDTPPWEHHPDGAAAAAAAADLVAVVVTPMRYGDASMMRLVEALGEDAPSALVLNRVAVPPEDRAQLIASVTDRFGVEPIVVDEGESLEPVGARLVDRLQIDSVEYQRSAVLRSAAASGSAYLANRMGDVALELRRLSSAIERESVLIPSERRLLPASDTWTTTRPMLVRAVTDELSSVDDALITHGGPLAPRVRAHLSSIDDDEVAETIDAWRAETTAAFLAASHVRWRRSSAERMLEEHAWRVALVGPITTPRRFRRILGDRLPRVASEARRRLEDSIAEIADDRVGEWTEWVEQLGDYAPGALLAAARDFDHTRTRDG